MANYRVISSDNHVFEAPDLWTSRAKPEFKDRVPQLVREYDGDWWYCDAHRVIGLAAGTQTGMRFEEPEKLVRTTTFDKVRRGGYDPGARHGYGCRWGRCKHCLSRGRSLALQRAGQCTAVGDFQGIHRMARRVLRRG